LGDSQTIEVLKKKNSQLIKSLDRQLKMDIKLIGDILDVSNENDALKKENRILLNLLKTLENKTKGPKSKYERSHYNSSNL